MTVLIVLGSILAFLLIVSLIRVGVHFEYGEDGIKVTAGVGPVRVKIYPAEKRKKKPGEKKEEEKKEKPGPLEELKEHLPDIRRMLSRIKKRRFIQELTVHFIAAGPDPAQAALMFGGVSAGYGIIAAVLENNFRIKKRDMRAAVDFEAEKPYLYVRIRLSLAVWEAVYVVYNLLISMASKRKPQTKPAGEAKLA
jgi:hypothetical protein